MEDKPEEHLAVATTVNPSSSSRRPSRSALSVCLSSSSDDFLSAPASSDDFRSCSDSESDNVGLSGPLERSRSESPT